MFIYYHFHSSTTMAIRMMRNTSLPLSLFMFSYWGSRGMIVNDAQMGIPYVLDVEIELGSSAKGV